MPEIRQENKSEFHIPITPGYLAIEARHTVTVPGEYGDTHARVDKSGIEPVKRLATRVYLTLRYGGLAHPPMYNPDEINHPPLVVSQATIDTVRNGFVQKKEYQSEVVRTDPLMTLKEAEDLYRDGNGYKTIVLFLESDRDRVKASRKILQTELHRLMNEHMSDEVRNSIYVDSPRQIADLSSANTLDFIKYLGVEDSFQLLPGWLYLRRDSQLEKLAHLRGCQTPTKIDSNIDQLRVYHFKEFLPLMKRGMRLFFFLYTHETHLIADAKTDNSVGFSSTIFTSVHPIGFRLRTSTTTFIDTPLSNR